MSPKFPATKAWGSNAASKVAATGVPATLPGVPTAVPEEKPAGIVSATFASWPAVTVPASVTFEVVVCRGTSFARLTFSPPKSVSKNPWMS